MNLEGYQSIEAALEEAGVVQAQIIPKPLEGHAEFVTIVTPPEFVASDVLNGLAKANLIGGAVARSMGGFDGPRLMPILSHEGSITFRDTNNHN